MPPLDKCAGSGPFILTLSSIDDMGWFENGICSASLDDVKEIGFPGIWLLLGRGETSGHEVLLPGDTCVDANELATSLGIRGNGEPNGLSSGLGLSGKPGLFGADIVGRSLVDAMGVIRESRKGAADSDRSITGENWAVTGRALGLSRVGNTISCMLPE